MIQRYAGVTPIELLQIPSGAELNGTAVQADMTKAVEQAGLKTRLVRNTWSLLSLYNAYIDGAYKGPNIGVSTPREGLQPFMFRGNPDNHESGLEPLPVHDAVRPQSRERAYVVIPALYEAMRAPEDISIRQFGGVALNHTNILLNTHIAQLSANEE